MPSTSLESDEEIGLDSEDEDFFLAVTIAAKAITLSMSDDKKVRWRKSVAYLWPDRVKCIQMTSKDTLG